MQQYQSEVGIDQKAGKYVCPPCEAGKYAGKKGMGSCLECTPGKYQEEDGASLCKICGIDEFTNTTQQIQCQNCSIGKYSTKGSVTCQICNVGDAGLPCVACDPGYYRGNTDSSTTCIACDVGFYTNHSGQSFCLDCDQGMYTNTPSSKTCKVCEEGQYTDEKRANTCKFCKGTDVPNEQQSGCVRPPHRLPEDCKIGSEYLNDSAIDKLDWTCESCLNGVSCLEFPSLSNLQPIEDYRRLTWTTDFDPGFGNCPAALACHWNYTTNGGCRKGHNPNSSVRF